MAKIVPTVLAGLPEEYRAMIKRAQQISKRVHVDISDGEFTDGHTINLAQVYVDEGVGLDLHLMVARIDDHIDNALSHKPRLIIVHAESKSDLAKVLDRIKSLGIEAGVALLPQTQPADVEKLIGIADHVLIFTGKLGYNGGEFQADQLAKVESVRNINRYVEISVDGGVNLDNAGKIANAGVDILYAGGYIQKADDPQKAFDELTAAIGGSK